MISFHCLTILILLLYDLVILLWQMLCPHYVTPSVRNQVIQALVLSHLGYCMVVWSSAAKKHIKKLQLAQNRAARLALQCTFKTNVMKMHNSLSWLTVEAKVTSSLVMFTQNAVVDRKPFFSSSHMTRLIRKGCFSVSQWNPLPIRIRSVNGKYRLKKIINI